MSYTMAMTQDLDTSTAVHCHGNPHATWHL